MWAPTGPGDDETGSRALYRRALLVVAALTLTACTGGPAAQFPITRMAPSGQALIQIQDPAFANAKIVRVWRLEAFEHESYVRYSTGSLTLEAVYDTALGVQVVLEYPYLLEGMAATWNANKGGITGWGPAKQAQAWHGKINYRTYRLASSGRQCAAFQSEWADVPYDPFGRPQKVLFGYLCAKAGDALPEQRVAAVLRSVAIDRRPDESLRPLFPRASLDPAALAAANGSAQPGTGNGDFPFSFGTTYFEGGNSFN